MVCIAAFIILIVIGLFVAIVSIFKREVGKTYLKMMKKALGCVSKKVRLQKCETGFKEDVKNTVLSRVIVKHPKWVKPLSIIMEILSVIIVAVTVWALLTAIKSLLALWALGTCNVTKPEACSLNSEIGCSIDKSEPTNIFESTGRWFEEWGDIFAAIPDKFRNYNPSEFTYEAVSVSENENPIALDIMDPGCSVCLRSYRNQKESGFFDKYNVKLVPFAIQNPDGSYKFKNSDITVRYTIATEKVRPGKGYIILDHIFADKNEDGIIYQTLFNNEYSKETAAAKIESWLAEAELCEDEIAAIRLILEDDSINTAIETNKNLIESQIHTNSIPTMIYDGGKHTGLYQNN